MKVHDLKTWPEPFEAMWTGQKRFEMRENNRDFQPGDRLNLYEFDPTTSKYTGRHLSADVTYILRGGAFGLPANLCVMSLIY